MARRYSRKKGKSGSHRPAMRVKQSWLTYEEKVIEQLVVKLAKQGKMSSEIGIVLRDSYGVPDVQAATKKSIVQIMKENGVGSGIPEDLKSLIKKDLGIMKHLEIGKKDKTAQRGLTLTGSKIGKLVKYYKRTKKLPGDWMYDRSKAKVLVE